MAKNLLNNLWGRYGIRLNNGKSKIMYKYTLDEISLVSKVVSYKNYMRIKY